MVGTAAFGLTTASGFVIGGFAATGIGLLVAVPLATLMSLIHFGWTRKGQAEDYKKLIMDKRAALKEKIIESVEKNA